MGRAVRIMPSQIGMKNQIVSSKLRKKRGFSDGDVTNENFVAENDTQARYANFGTDVLVVKHDNQRSANFFKLVTDELFTFREI
jgi:hypothetical protein